MEAFIVIAIFLLALFVAAFALRQRNRAKLTKLLGAPTAFSTAQLKEWSGPRGLFDDPESDAAFALAEAEGALSEQYAALLARAAAGEVNVLAEAEAQGGDEFYQQALAELVRAVRADDEALQTLVNHITQNEHWRANAVLAAAVLDRWQRAPGQHALGELLHVAALSDDAAMFQHTAEAALEAWRAGCLGWASAQTLHAMIESEYWILAPAARQSGAGFVLKRMLVAVRRQLAAATPRASSAQL